jgi:hypothetical protein
VNRFFYHPEFSGGNKQIKKIKKLLHLYIRRWYNKKLGRKSLEDGQLL